MKRSATELSNSIKDLLGDNQPDGLETLLEDIADSTGEFDAKNFVEKAEYEKVVTERDVAKLEVADLRSKYINRFYNRNSEGFDALGGEMMKNDTEVLPYESLFE